MHGGITYSRGEMPARSEMPVRKRYKEVLKLTGKVEEGRRI